MIPRAQKAYDLYLNNFRQMAAAYLQVLIAQRNLAKVIGRSSAWVSDLLLVGRRLGRHRTWHHGLE